MSVPIIYWVALITQPVINRTANKGGFHNAETININTIFSHYWIYWITILYNTNRKEDRLGPLGCSTCLFSSHNYTRTGRAGYGLAI